MNIKFTEDYEYIINIESYAFFNVNTIEKFQKWVDSLVNSNIICERMEIFTESPSYRDPIKGVQIAFTKTYEDMEFPLNNSLFVANFNQNLAIVAYWMGKEYTPTSMRNRVKLWLEMVFRDNGYQKYIVTETRLWHNIDLSFADKLVRHQEILEKLRQYKIKYENELGILK